MPEICRMRLSELLFYMGAYFEHVPTRTDRLRGRVLEALRDEGRLGAFEALETNEVHKTMLIKRLPLWLTRSVNSLTFNSEVDDRRSEALTHF